VRAIFHPLQANSAYKLRITHKHARSLWLRGWLGWGEKAIQTKSNGKPLAKHRKRQENNVHGTNGAGVVDMQSKPKARRTKTDKCQGEHTHGTSWAAEGNKQSKQQTCLLLALLVPFRSPVNEIHWKRLENQSEIACTTR